jgi:hypothetical protein
MPAVSVAGGNDVPAELSPRRLGRRMIELAAVGVVVLLGRGSGSPQPARPRISGLRSRRASSSTAAVLAYHTIAIWVPAVLGSVAFVQLRNTLRRESSPAAICAPLAEPIDAEPRVAHA